MSEQIASALQAFMQRHPRLCVLTGAGVSTAAGIPDYRDAQGAWKGARPVEFQPFMTTPSVRQRYWARSLVGWPFIAGARPSATHRALAQLESRGAVQVLITQNVDGLHQAAGSRNVIDLHGRLDLVRCMQCTLTLPRGELQSMLVANNPKWESVGGRIAPDGDVELDHGDYDGFVVPDCQQCGGILKPDVVFFGEPVPRERVALAFEGVAHADALLVVGTSLMVYSGYRFAEAAASAGKPIAAVNMGRTRADHLYELKISASCDEIFGPVMTEPCPTRTAC